MPTTENVAESSANGTSEATTRFAVYCDCGLVSPSGNIGDREDAIARWAEMQMLIAAGREALQIAKKIKASTDELHRSMPGLSRDEQ